jgi:hypothetical protein
MNRFKKLIISSLLLLGIGFGLTACVGVVDDGPGYYHHDGWYHDGPWMGGPRGYVGVGVGIHPYR